MKKVKNPATQQWVAQMAKAVKEDQQVIMELADRVQEAKSKQKPIKKQVEELIDDANYSREVLKCEYTWSNTLVSKDIGLSSAQHLMEELKALDIVFKNQKGEWVMKARYAGRGLEKYYIKRAGGKTHSYLKWTQKGRQWLHALVKRGIIQPIPRPRVPLSREKPEPSCKTTRELASSLGMKSEDLEVWLHEAGIVCWNESGIVPKLIYVDEGYCESRSRTKGGCQDFYPVWTQKGVAWIKELMKMENPHDYLRNELARQFREEQESIKYGRHNAAAHRMPQPVRNTELLINMISQMQEYFDCIISLARECVTTIDENERKLLKGDIRSINDSTPLMMRKLEDECYKALAMA